MKKLAIISTHPIQYNAPWFAMLAQQPEMELKVFYTWSQRQTEFFDDNFGKEIKWDIPILEGYDYEFVENRAKKPGNKSFWGIQCPDLTNRINAFNPTHILVFGWNFQAHFAVMRHFKGKIPVLFRGDSTLLDYEITSLGDVFRQTSTKNPINRLKVYLHYKLRKIVLSFVYRYIDTGLYVGTHNKAYFIHHGLKEDQLCFVPHAIDNDRFTDSPEKGYEQQAEVWKSDLGITDEDFVFLFAGKLESKKAPLLLISAFIKACKAAPHIKLVMVGSGPLEKEVKNKIVGNAQIIMLPFQNQSRMPLVYRLGNILCLPSQGPGETWGLAVNESLACGRPVIVSDKVGCSVDLAINESGYIFKSGSEQELANLILMAASQSGSANQRANKNLLASTWSYNTMTNNLLSLLSKSNTKRHNL